MKHFGVLAFMVGMALSSLAAMKKGEDGPCMPQKRLRSALKGGTVSGKDSLGMKKAKTFKVEGFNPLLAASEVPLRKAKSLGWSEPKAEKPKVVRIKSNPDVKVMSPFPDEEEVLTEVEESDTE